MLSRFSYPLSHAYVYTHAKCLLISVPAAKNKKKKKTKIITFFSFLSTFDRLVPLVPFFPAAP